MEKSSRFGVLDGWRALSILLVLAAHWLPLGPKSCNFNETAGIMGMALFFILSGFLITNILMKDGSVTNFVIRRLTRIIPLAWLGLLLTFLFEGLAWNLAPSHFLFWANLPPISLTDNTSIYWSLCVEVQFYVVIGLLVLLFRDRAFWILPFLWVAITAFRAFNNVPVSIVTYLRVDEILSGCVLALAHRNLGEKWKALWGRLPIPLMVIFLFLCSIPAFQVMCYFRPTASLLLVGSSLFRVKKSWPIRLLESRFLAFIARISYAIYVWHGFWGGTWLGSETGMMKYFKRPLLAAVTLASACLTTFTFEKWFVDKGHQWVRLRKERKSSGKALNSASGTAVGPSE